jgi:hypothetical protein
MRAVMTSSMALLRLSRRCMPLCLALMAARDEEGWSGAAEKVAPDPVDEIEGKLVERNLILVDLLEKVNWCD